MRLSECDSPNLPVFSHDSGLLAKLLFAMDMVLRKLFYFILMTVFILCNHSQRHKCEKNNSCNKVLFNLK